MNCYGRGKLNGVHAGLIVLTPLGDQAETLETAHSGHTPLEPPPSILNTVYSALKNAFSSTAASYTAPAPSYTAPGHITEPVYQPPPPLTQPLPDFKPMSWGAVDSYGLPAASDSYLDYDPRTPSASVTSYDYAAPKRTVVPTIHKKGLTPEKIQKIQHNIKKVTSYLKHQQRSSEDFNLTDMETYKSMLANGQIPFLPTPIVYDNEIGVLPAETLDPLTTTSSSTTTTSTTAKPNTSENEQHRRKDVKYILRGNKIVQV